MVKMYGPSISDPSKTVNRDVPELDVPAYEAAGYVKGEMPEVVYTEADAIVQNNGDDDSTAAKRGKKATK